MLDKPIREYIDLPMPVDIPWLDKLASEVLLTATTAFDHPNQGYWLKGEIITKLLEYTKIYGRFCGAVEIYRDQSRVQEYDNFLNGRWCLRDLLPCALVLFDDNLFGWDRLSRAVASGLLDE